jgi:hypothetical protein
VLGAVSRFDSLLTGPAIPSAAETIRRMLMNLATLLQGSAELRNAYGTSTVPLDEPRVTPGDAGRDATSAALCVGEIIRRQLQRLRREADEACTSSFLL